jgi:hypothetical protein
MDSHSISSIPLDEIQIGDYVIFSDGSFLQIAQEEYDSENILDVLSNFYKPYKDTELDSTQFPRAFRHLRDCISYMVRN